MERWTTVAHAAPEPETRPRAELRDLVANEVSKVVVGHDDGVELVFLATLTGGHVLVEGPPGVAKTLLAGAVARALGVSFARVQFTPDTSPGDVTGTTIVRAGERQFLPGAIFTNLLLADEINRTPPRTQAALLEAMQERHVTVDGTTRWLPSPFMVVATQNPFETEGVFPLPEGQLDRFLFKIHLGYGDADQELRMLRLPHRGVSPDMLEDVSPIVGPARLGAAQQEVDRIEVPDETARVVVDVVRATRHHEGVVLGASPRAAIHVLAAAKANAWLAGRDAVARADIERVALPVLGHRLVVDGADPAEIVGRALATAGR